jgi:heme/copper-type cytochrome/quinol oxidase subunit 2
MKMVIIVDTKADYEKWLKSQKTLAQSTPVVSENSVALK